MFNWLKNLIGGAQANEVAEDALAQAPVANDNMHAANDTEAPVEFSLTGETDKALAAMLKHAKVKRHGHDKAQDFPIASVRGLELRSDDAGNEFGFVGRSGEQDVPHGEKVHLTVRLSAPAGDYEATSLKNTIPQLLNHVPAFAGKIVAKPSHAHQPTYLDVGKELAALLSKKEHAQTGQPLFTAEEKGTLEQFFAAHIGQRDEAQRWHESIRADHYENRVSIHINPAHLQKDDNATVSSDSAVTDFIKSKQDVLFTKFKEKVLALGVLKPEQLEHLEMHPTMSGWGVKIDFGNKPASDKDAEGNTLSESEYLKKLGETDLAKIDTEKLGKLFTESLLEVTPTLEPSMARIMDAPMLADIIRKRLPNDAELNGFLAQHDMFKRPDQIKAEEKAAVSHHQITVPEARVHRGMDGKPDELQVEFELPLGMTLPQVQAGILQAKSQMGLAVRDAAAQAQGAARAA